MRLKLGALCLLFLLLCHLLRILQPNDFLGVPTFSRSFAAFAARSRPLESKPVILFPLELELFGETELFEMLELPF